MLKMEPSSPVVIITYSRRCAWRGREQIPFREAFRTVDALMTGNFRTPARGTGIEDASVGKEVRESQRLHVVRARVQAVEDAALQQRVDRHPLVLLELRVRSPFVHHQLPWGPFRYFEYSGSNGCST